MRQLTLKTAPENRDKVSSLLEKLEAKNVSEFEKAEYVYFEFYLDNSRVQSFFSNNQAQDAEIVLNPHGMLPLHPPSDEAPDQVVDVSLRSPVEIFLSSLQSIGSWGSLVAYSIASAVVAFTGLYTGVVYLLTASMLIAPFAGPVMNAALAGAAGQPRLLGSSLARYAVSILISVAVSLLLSLAAAVEVLPPLADSLSRLSHINMLLPLFAGFAGAVSIINSERNNLVSGAGVGILVAASLAPPAAILGMTIYLGDSDILFINLYKLLLQVAGIQLSASLVFRFWGGISTLGARFHKGKNSIFVISIVITIAATLYMGYLQYNDEMLFQRNTAAYNMLKTSNDFFSKEKNLRIIDLNTKVTKEKMGEQYIAWCEATLYDEEEQTYTEKSLQGEYLELLSAQFPDLFFVAKVTLVEGEK